MRAMDILVHPSLTESFGQVIVEAMAAGTPVAGSAVGGVAEIVNHGKTGMLFPAATASEIVRTVLELYCSPELRRRLASAAKKDVAERFSIEKMVHRQIECYRSTFFPPLSSSSCNVATQA
jgi:glycosyltransferase involved in cell wall biosynthesis